MRHGHTLPWLWATKLRNFGRRILVMKKFGGDGGYAAGRHDAG